MPSLSGEKDSGLSSLSEECGLQCGTSGRDAAGVFLLSGEESWEGWWWGRNTEERTLEELEALEKRDTVYV